MAEPTPNSTTPGLLSTLVSYSDQASSLLESGYSVLADTATSAQNYIANQASEAANSVYQTTEAATESAAVIYDSVSTKGIVPTLWAYTPESVKSTAYDVTSNLIGERQVNTLIRSAEAFWNAESGEGIDAVTDLVQKEYSKELDGVYETLGQYYKSAKKRVKEFFNYDESSTQAVAPQTKASSSQSIPSAETVKSVAVENAAKSISTTQPVILKPQFIVPENYTSSVSRTTDSNDLNTRLISIDATQTLTSDQDSLSSDASRILLDISLESEQNEFTQNVMTQTDSDATLVATSSENFVPETVTASNVTVVSESSKTAQTSDVSDDSVAIESMIGDQNESVGQNLQTVTDGSVQVNQDKTSSKNSFVTTDNAVLPEAVSQSEIQIDNENSDPKVTVTSSSDQREAVETDTGAVSGKSSNAIKSDGVQGLFAAEIASADQTQAGDIAGYAVQLSEEQYAHISHQQLFQGMLVNLSGFAGRISRKAESVMDTAVEDDLSTKAMGRLYHVVSRSEMNDSESHPESEQHSSEVLEEELNPVSEGDSTIHSRRPRDVSISYV